MELIFLFFNIINSFILKICFDLKVKKPCRYLEELQWLLQNCCTVWDSWSITKEKYFKEYIKNQFNTYNEERPVGLF